MYKLIITTTTVWAIFQACLNIKTKHNKAYAEKKCHRIFSSIKNYFKERLTSLSKTGRAQIVPIPNIIHRKYEISLVKSFSRFFKSSFVATLLKDDSRVFTYVFAWSDVIPDAIRSSYVFNVSMCAISLPVKNYLGNLADISHSILNIYPKDPSIIGKTPIIMMFNLMFKPLNFLSNSFSFGFISSLNSKKAIFKSFAETYSSDLIDDLLSIKWSICNALLISSPMLLVKSVSRYLLHSLQQSLYTFNANIFKGIYMSHGQITNCLLQKGYIFLKVSQPRIALKAEESTYCAS